jgi:hypothetical protein
MEIKHIGKKKQMKIERKYGKMRGRRTTQQKDYKRNKKYRKKT